MNPEEIIARLRANEAMLRKRGVAHAALFGSRARGEQGPHSGTDFMVEIDPNAPVGVWEYAGIKTYIASLFEGPVDVVDREGLKSYVKPAATAEAIYAFCRRPAASPRGFRFRSPDIKDVILRYFVDFGLSRSYGGTLEVSHDHYR